MPAAQANVMQRSIPHSQFALISGAGHLSNVEQPAQFNDAIAAFLSRI
jgi:pimeloyl-ACP methyl ester carboxylesterase